MSNTNFIVPKLVEADCWIDMRGLVGGYGWRGNRPLESITNIITHHTDTNRNGNASKEFMEIWNHRRCGGTAYHLLISSEIRNGLAVVGYMGDLGSIRAHATNIKGKDRKPARKGNNYSIGISFIGRHQFELPLPEMLKSAKLAIDELIFNDNRFSGLTSYNQVKGHGYWDQTWCPDGKEGTILNPQIFNILMEDVMNDNREPSVKDLEDATKWQDEMKKKYNMVIIGELSTALDRRLLVMFYRYSRYLQLSPKI